MADNYVDQMEIGGVLYDIHGKTDAAFDKTSENPVQNKLIAEVIGENADGKTVVRTDESQELTFKQRMQALANLGISYRFGFKREKDNSDPAGRITYLYDAEGLQPAGMTFDAETGIGTFNYGDWKGFIEAVARPVMLKTNGTVDYELDHEDQTKKLDGTASDIESSSYDGNAMTEFGSAFKWVKRYEDATYEYVIFCNLQYDSTYHAYAHTADDETIKDAFYLGMWCGPVVSSKLRSIGNGGAVMNNLTAEVEITRAKANGSGYNILYKSAWDYVSDLCTLISKSDDAQTAFGTGVDNRLNSRQTAGQLRSVGPFYGTNDGKSCMKVFWLVDYWGNLWQRLAGCINDNGAMKVRMTGPYCDTPVSDPDYSTYVDAGVTPAGTSGGYQKTSKVSDETGYLWISLSGSSTTYVPDGGWYNNGQLDFALVGASYYYDPGLAGSRTLHVYYLASRAAGDIGSRLSYIPA